jgi:hypothetical protein
VAESLQAALTEQAAVSVLYRSDTQALPLVTGLHVDGVGAVALPISNKSPLLSLKTTSGVVSIDAQKFSFDNPAWQKEVDNLAADVVESLDLRQVCCS